MISPFETMNLFLINLAVLLLTTSMTGGIVTVIWMAVGKALEKKGYVRIVFELMKLSVFFFCFPISYTFLKLFEMELGRGYLFSPTLMIIVCVKGFLAVWVCGSVCMVLYTIYDIRKLNRRYQDAFPCDISVQAIYCTVADQLGLVGHAGKRLPQLAQSYSAPVPLLKGAIRPMVILPVKEYTERELTVIFMHELTHHKQKDILLKMGMKLLLTVHFYNPLAWFLFFQIQVYSEYACDDRVCVKAGGMRWYFETIVNMSVRGTIHTGLSSQLVENQHELVERVRRMKTIYGKKRSKWSAVLILCTALMVSTLSVSAATVETAARYCAWNKATVEEFECTTPQPVYEVLTEQGDAEDITVVEWEVPNLSRTTNTIDWSVNNNIKMVGSYFSCQAGDRVTVTVDLTPDTATVKVGIENANGSKMYVSVQDFVSNTFNIEESGSYRFFIENTSGKTITAEGSYVHL